MKCEICKNSIEETFLKKPVGTYLKDKKGKKHIVCPGCQRKFSDKSKLLEQL
jgi:hypothetical protein